MTFAVHVDVDDRATQLQLTRLVRGTSAASVSGWLGAPMASFIHKRTSSRFAAQGDDVTGRWLALKAATGAFRTAQGFGAFRPINVRTGHMLHALLTHAVADDTLSVPGPVDSFASLKIATAQRGKPGNGRQGATVPRPVLGVGTTDEAFAVNSLLDWITAGAA